MDGPGPAGRVSSRHDQWFSTVTGEMPRETAAAAGPPAVGGRAPLCATALTGMLVTPGALWRAVRVVPQTGSTNADLLAEARSGAAEGTVLAAESQTAGRVPP
jgi:hypothetical protein